MNLRDMNKFIKTIQSQLIQGQKCDYSMEDCAILLGAYHHKGGRGKIEGLTNEQIVIACVSEFYLNEITRLENGNLQTSPVDNINSLLVKFNNYANSIGLVVKNNNVLLQNEIRVQIMVNNSPNCSYITGKELRSPYKLELGVNYSMFKIHYPMLIEDLTMAILGAKGCAFTNTTKTTQIIRSLNRRLS